MTHIPYLQPDVKPDNDCSTRLLVMGIIMIVMGGFGACFSLSIPFGLIMMTRTSGVYDVHVGSLIAGMAVWPIVATVLIWTGIGSVQKRRWVRPIVLVFATFGLLTGIVALVSTCLSIPLLTKSAAMPTAVPTAMPMVVMTSRTVVVKGSTTGPTTAPVATKTVVTTMPPPMLAPFVVSMVVSNLLVGVGLPLLFLLLYRSQYVRSTLEFYDPNFRWTDPCPIPVLGLAIASLIAAIFMPLSAIPGTMFLFGVAVSGVPLAVVAAGIAAVLALTAWKAYRLKLIGWQSAIVVVCIGAASSITTLFRTPMEEIYRASGMSASQIQFSSQLHSTATTSVISVVWSALAIAFVLYTRRFFPGGSQFSVDDSGSTPPPET